MFLSRRRLVGAAGVVDAAFTDSRAGDAATDVGVASIAEALGLQRLAVMRQVHGRDVVVVTSSDGSAPTCDALVTSARGVGLCVRVADCVPVALADPDAGVVGVVHAGRNGVASGVVEAAVAELRRQGAATITAWIGPHVCGGCYEVPAELRDEVADAVPATFACTTWGTPALDLGAGVSAQLAEAGCDVVDVSACTRESDGLHSYRRDGAAAGRLAGVVVLRDGADG